MPLTAPACQIAAIIQASKGKPVANQAENTGGRAGIPWRLVGWSIPVLLLLLPYVADAPWSVGDYIFAAILFGAIGLAFELIVRTSSSLAYRLGAATAVVAAFLIVNATGAVGMIGDEGDPYNLLFFGVIALALGGSILARFRAQGMAYAMAGAFVAQAGLSVGGMPLDLRGGTLGALLGGVWLLSAALFWKDAQSNHESNELRGGSSPRENGGK